MASIFTFDPDPPRVSSPWSTPRASTPGQQASSQQPGTSQSVDVVTRELGEELTLTKLEAEPQEGPTEYKLHLLLRPRRSFSSISTVAQVSGSYRQRLGTALAGTALASTPGRGSDAPAVLSNTPPAPGSYQTRQHRLEQLTTQLLWRLQQSSPYHSSTSSQLVLPQLPEATPQLSTQCRPNRLLPGLEESRGALYEIGVSDDGTFVGLAEDEMEESLANLRAMAASLGCTVEVVRMVAVGECEWSDLVQLDGGSQRELRSGKLWVAEAYVKPDLSLSSAIPSSGGGGDSAAPAAASSASQKGDVQGSAGAVAAGDPRGGEASQGQLRISLTGATSSGKSSLLGCLTTATLDNGRGSSRVSLMKHRHEIASGMTSSVTQELIGYRRVEGVGWSQHPATPSASTTSSSFSSSSPSSTAVRVVNYGSDNVSSWTDVHEAAGGGRLVFLSDSAGHLRYRRTTVRGLVGWAPQWALLCIPADELGGDAHHGRGGGSMQSSQEAAGLAAAADIDLSRAHLDLCLDLGIPLIVAITKLDLASKVGLRQVLSKLLTALKAAGRRPSILSDAAADQSGADLRGIGEASLEAARELTRLLSDDVRGMVPIVLTSAVKGIGICKLHALMHELPIPDIDDIARPRRHGERGAAAPSPLFHVEDVFSAPRLGSSTFDGNFAAQIVGGHLKYGTIHRGDELVLGPFGVGPETEGQDIGVGGLARSREGDPAHRGLALPRPNTHYGGQRHHGGDPNLAAASRVGTTATTAAAVSASSSCQHTNLPEWLRVRVASLRNLRLPVRALRAGQVGTVGIVPLSAAATDQPTSDASALSRIRKGMVLAAGSPQPPPARRAFVARFEVDEVAAATEVGDHRARTVRELTVGTVVVVYVASVRASAKVVAIGIDEDGRAAGRIGPPGPGGDIAAANGRVDGPAEDIWNFEPEDESGGEPGGGNTSGSESDVSFDEDTSGATLVTFRFLASREFIEIGANVLVMPGGGPGLYGGMGRGEKGVPSLEGFVGTVVEESGWRVQW